MTTQQENLLPEEEISSGITNVNQSVFKDAEFCFQFDDEEPVVFAWPDDPVPPESEEAHEITFSVKAIEGNNLVFGNGNRTFKIFAREISQATLETREKSK